MKTKKIITIILIFVFIISLLIWTIPSLTRGQTVSPNLAPDEAVTTLIKEGIVYNQALGIGEPKVLPGNIFYFIKNIYKTPGVVHIEPGFFNLLKFS